MTGTILNGSLAVIKVDNKVVGIFDSCTYTVTMGTEAVHVCGRSSPAEVSITSQEAVSVQCTGFRLVEFSAYTLPMAPKLQDLLSLEDVTISITDRSTGKNVLIVSGCKVSGHSGGVHAKSLSRISISYIGTKVEMEDSSQQEAPNSVDLP